MDGCTLSGGMKLFVHNIYELQKGIRSMALCTINREDEEFALQRLQKTGITYVVYDINDKHVNLFFGKKECIEVVRAICNRPLNQLSPEEDFILGIMLGYDVCQQCTRYSQRKNLKHTA